MFPTVFNTYKHYRRFRQKNFSNNIFNNFQNLLQIQCVVPENIHTPTHHEGNFMPVLPSPRDFHFLNAKITWGPPPLRNFHKFYVHPPPYPLEENSFGKKVF